MHNEIDFPDMWEELKQYQITSEIMDDEENSNSPFTEEQLPIIIHGIEQIRTYLLKEYQKDEEIKLINEKLDYLIDASKRQGRFDWRNVFVSIIINIGTSLALSPEQFQHIKNMLSVAWNGFIRLIGS